MCLLNLLESTRPKNKPNPLAAPRYDEASGAPEGVTCRHPPRRPVKSVKVGGNRGAGRGNESTKRLIKLYR